MPNSIDPLPKDDELECAQCGAYFFHQLTRCPECGVNIFEPEDDKYIKKNELTSQENIFIKIGNFFQRLFGKTNNANELFKDALDHMDLFEELLSKIGNDHNVANRLIDYEQKQMPKATRSEWIKNAIQRWERDNRIISSNRN